MQRRLCSVLACAGALSLTASGVAAASPPGTSPLRVGGATQTGKLPDRQMRVVLALSPSHAAELNRLVSGAHAPISSARFRARFSPAAGTVRSVTAWARVTGLRASVTPDRLLVTLTGGSSTIGRALGTAFGEFTAPGAGRYFATLSPAKLPRAFAGRVSAVLGLSSLGRFSLPGRHTRASARPAAGTGLAYPNSYGPQDFWGIYNAPAAQTGAGQQLAIITEGDLSQPKRDLVTFEQHFGLPAVTWNQIQVGAATPDVSGNGEWDLDSQYSTGFAPGVSQLNVYVGPSLANADIATTIDRFVTDNLSRQGSFSAGECEVLASASGLMSALDPILKEADAQGQSMFFSSGDTGAFCPAVIGVNGVPAGIPNVGYPASSPYAIGVGGTSLLSPSGPEAAWYAAGGGPSLLEAKPAWQTATLAGAAPLPARGEPDVSLDADPNSGYQVIVAGALTTIGGTSASNPAWQGIWARAQGAHGGTLGFAGPVLYSPGVAGAYRDVTLGANGFPATPGYDYATGLGTVDITKFVAGA